MRKDLKISKNTVVHCYTEEDANKVLKIAHELGYKWADRTSFICSTYWRLYREDTCYNLHSGGIADVSFYEEIVKHIISADEFIKLHTPLSIKIDIPEGYVIDEENSSFSEIKFKEKETNPLDKLPKSWEELDKIEGWYITSTSDINKLDLKEPSIWDKSTFPTKEEAEAAVALAQLCQLRDRYNGEPLKDWVNMWNNKDKYFIYVRNNFIETRSNCSYNFFLVFKTSELRDKFLSCPEIRKLIEIAKPLI